MSSLIVGIVEFAQMFDVGPAYRCGSASCLFRYIGLVLRWLIFRPLGAMSPGAFTLIVWLPVPPEVAIGLVILGAAGLAIRLEWL